MNIKKTLAIAGAVTTIGAASMVGLASAATDTGGTSPMDSLVQKIAEKFNLNQEEVQAVFDEEHEAREAERQQEVEDALSQAVTDGKLTEDQKQKILDKREALETERESDRESMDSKTDEERRELMDTKRDELESWAEENDIPDEYVRYVMGGPGHGGPGGPGGPRPTDSTN